MVPEEADPFEKYKQAREAAQQRAKEVEKAQAPKRAALPGAGGASAAPKAPGLRPRVGEAGGLTSLLRKGEANVPQKAAAAPSRPGVPPVRPGAAPAAPASRPVVPAKTPSPPSADPSAPPKKIVRHNFALGDVQKMKQAPRDEVAPPQRMTSHRYDFGGKPKVDPDELERPKHFESHRADWGKTPRGQG
ncbi:MAG: hypothetical protein L0216_20660 [Planctomycetales bacterium]|nr:hypothetical protein [Planctomycetales bacterium]